MKNFAFSLLLMLVTPNVFAEPSWSYGEVDLLESFSDYVVVRWTGPKTQECGSGSHAVRFDADSLGNEAAFNRAVSIAMTAQVSQKPIRFKLDGCIGEKQKATIVQLCTNSDCTYNS
ncbi:hypothetical protein ACJJI5_16225 [Microbulbifer sp. EKSA008]|uniref:hypothetical protein n=1 Tax=Microbulbifer sp. EKSA008 TaxID=3243367 RepID=UPI004041A9F3